MNIQDESVQDILEGLIQIRITSSDGSMGKIRYVRVAKAFAENIEDVIKELHTDLHPNVVTKITDETTFKEG